MMSIDEEIDEELESASFRHHYSLTYDWNNGNDTVFLVYGKSQKAVNAAVKHMLYLTVNDVKQILLWGHLGQRTACPLDRVTLTRLFQTSQVPIAFNKISFTAKQSIAFCREHRVEFESRDDSR